jgi:hypothetical protein
MAKATKKLTEKESPPDLPGGCTAGQSLAEVVGGMHRRTDERTLGRGTTSCKCGWQRTHARGVVGCGGKLRGDLLP